ncbi:hypothetical protein VST7929_02400 [Vibrio stylophorae]|uniref:MSHA biogenesis protein MshP n=1 Tax=Vibrio stylophorae TaxID=659351 RepID=A0ABN8DUM9_9VIBR|nr:MSHA biogenesis protein MshP [Vibrio stylophorae]CAH0534467.1 hypothetical protein VST7929_02400 [Vibrio stylophorae]
MFLNQQARQQLGQPCGVQGLRHQRGNMLVLIVFILVVMASLAIAMMRINASSVDTTTKEVMATRAWFAAQSGADWALTRLFPLSGGPAVCQYHNLSAPSTKMPGATGLYGCAVQVSCTSTEVIDRDQRYTAYRILSTGTCGTDMFQVSRHQDVWAKNLHN